MNAVLVVLVILEKVVYSRQDFPSFLCVNWESNEKCLGGEAALTDTELRISYKLDESSIKNLVVSRDRAGSRFQLLESPAVNSQLTLPAKYTFLQLEHGGGICNCARIYFQCDATPESREIHLCDGSASVSRRITALWSSSSNISQTVSLEEKKLSPFHLPCNKPNMKIYFWISSNQNSGLDQINSRNKGIEFSIRVSSLPNEWIPLQYIYFQEGYDEFNYIDIRQGTEDNLFIRGYSVVQRQVSDLGEKVVIDICNISSTDSVQFRWLQTSLFRPDQERDIWGLDDIQIVHISDSGTSAIILNETFSGNDLNDQIWPNENIRDARISTYSNKENVLVFGLESVNATPTYNSSLVSENDLAIQSRSILTKRYKLANKASINPIIALNCDDQLHVINELDSIVLQLLQSNIDTKVLSTPEFNEINNAKEIDVKISLASNITTYCDANLYILSYLFQFLSECVASTTYSPSILEELINLGSIVLNVEKFRPSQSSLSAGTTVLSSFDFLLLTYVPQNGIFYTPSITLQSELINLNSSVDPVTAINTTNILGFDGPTIVLTIPLNFLQVFDIDRDGYIRIVTAIFRNASMLLLFGEQNGTVFGSDIVAATLQCNNKSCPTSAIELVSNLSISIDFEHSKETKQLVEEQDLEITCVFLEITSSNNSIFTIGHWSTRGCTRNTSLSSTFRTVCNCNHLTHFAILLSPRPPNFKADITLSLMAIGYIGVIISVIAMMLTIFTFTFLKSLHSMRNYIHIHLCINLSIAQIIFVAGVDKTGSGIPFHCQFVAVLLHYFFLVSFMWMLMEGVVLYVALVIVFVKNKKYYVLAFTAASYGVPLVYMGLLTLPLGFGLSNRDNYGTSEVCFLNHSNNFIWAFIAPVVLIILINIVLFIIAARIMWQHHLKNTDKEKIQNIRHWFQSAVSLVVVMGLTWISGILIIAVDELLPLAYIFTIMVAFQGLFIFLIFVVFSKAVREAYVKWWRVKISQYDFLSKHFSKSISSSISNSSKKIGSAHREVGNSNTKDVKEK